MSWFGQEQYNDKMGNGTFTIREIGCFVTAFSNLLAKFGEGEVAPNVLNVFLTEHNVYLADPLDGVGVKDDLSWGSITAYDHSVSVAATGSGSWPNSDNAIIEFRFNENGKEITHFCLVDSVANKTIVDSWDGQVKEPGKYGAPVAWASYVRNVPQPVPVPIPTSKVAVPPPNYDGQSITIQPGWGLSNAAQAAGFPDAGSESRWQAIAVLNGSASWQAFNASLKPGERIKVGKYEASAPAAPTVSHEPGGWKTITVQPGWGLERVAAAAGRPDANLPECWQEITVANDGTTWQSFNAHLQPGQQVKVPPQGFHGEGEDSATPSADLPTPPTDRVFAPELIQLDTSKLGLYKAKESLDVKNLANENQSEHLEAGSPVTVAAGFTFNNVNYLLPTFAYRQKSWYAVPESCLQSMANPVKAKVGAYGHLLEAYGFCVGRLKRKAMKKASV